MSTTRKEEFVRLRFEDQEGNRTAPLPRQLEVLKAKRPGDGLTRIACVGGFGSGKTAVALVRGFMSIFRAPHGSNCILAAQSLNDVKNVVLKRALARFPPHHPGQPPEDRIRPREWSPAFSHVSLDEKWFRLVDELGGHTFYWTSADAEGHLQGIECATLIGDEVSRWREKEWLRLASRVRTKSPDRCLVFNAIPIAGGWFEEMCRSEGTDLFKFSTRDNIHQSAEYVDELLGSMGEEQAAMYIDGEFVSPSGVVYKQYDSGSRIEFAHNPQWDVRLAVDFGFNSPHCLAVQAIDGGDFRHSKLVVFDELAPTRVTTAEFAQQIVRYGLENGWKVTHVACDPAGAAQVASAERGMNDIMALRTTLREAWPSVKVVYQTDTEIRRIQVGVDIVRALFKNAAGERSLFLAESMARKRHRGRLGLHDSLLTYVLPTDGKIDPDKPVKDGVSDHACDALRYFALCFRPRPIKRIEAPTKAQTKHIASSREIFNLEQRGGTWGREDASTGWDFGT